MSDVARAAAAARSLGAKFRQLVLLADLLEKIGSIEQNERETLARIEVLRLEEADLQNRLPGLRAEVERSEEIKKSLVDLQAVFEIAKAKLAEIEQQNAEAQIRANDLEAQATGAERRLATAQKALEALHAQFRGAA